MTMSMVRRVVRKARSMVVGSTAPSVIPPLPISPTANPHTLNQAPPSSQDLDVYFDPAMGEILETWGKDHVWKEIVFLSAPLSGRFLDIACGTGAVMEILRDQLGIEVVGCDIAEPLLDRARLKGFADHQLRKEDASAMSFADNEFDYSYSIGSLEHFTLEGIDGMVSESARVSRHGAFHMIPVSRTGADEGWMTTFQSYFNNSQDWWLPKFQKHFREVHVVDSGWNDKYSHGRWFICKK